MALLGSSGSGKSSLLNLIAGLDHPTWRVIVKDSDLAELSREELAKHRLHTVGMVFQSFNLISRMKLPENVELPMRFAEVDRRKRAQLPGKRWNDLDWPPDGSSASELRRRAAAGLAGPRINQSAQTPAGG